MIPRNRKVTKTQACRCAYDTSAGEEDTFKPLAHWLASLAWLVSCKSMKRSPFPTPRCVAPEEGHLRLTSGLYMHIAQNHIWHNIRKLRNFSTRPIHWNPKHELFSFCHSLTTGFFVCLHFIHILPNGINKSWREMVSNSEHKYIWVWILVLSFSVILRSFLGFFHTDTHTKAGGH